MAIPEAYKEDLVYSSLHFMRALDKAYGSESAMTFWSALSDVVDPDLKGLTFQAMLTGEIGGQIVVRGLPNVCNKVGVIKAIRTWDRRALSLKDAKHMVDLLESSGKPIVLEINHEKLPPARADFKHYGCTGTGL